MGDRIVRGEKKCIQRTLDTFRKKRGESGSSDEPHVPVNSPPEAGALNKQSKRRPKRRRLNNETFDGRNT